MMLKSTMFATVALLGLAVPAAAADAPTDPQIAHIAYTAGVIDVAAGKQALARSHNKAVRSFAQEMVRDHSAVNDKALALVKSLHVTPQDNPTSQALTKQADAERAKLAISAERRSTAPISTTRLPITRRSTARFSRR